jgi:hypothetical protein
VNEKIAVKGVITSAHKKNISEYKDADGNPLQPIPYEGEVLGYAASEVAEAKASSDWLKDDEIVDVINARKVAAKRQELIKGKLEAAGVKAPTLEDDSVAIAMTVKTLMARKLCATVEEAEARARQILGID